MCMYIHMLTTAIEWLRLARLVCRTNGRPQYRLTSRKSSRPAVFPSICQITNSLINVGLFDSTTETNANPFGRSLHKVNIVDMISTTKRISCREKKLCGGGYALIYLVTNGPVYNLGLL